MCGATSLSPSPGSSMADTIVDFQLGDVLRLRKVHPCGGDTWLVVRLGADIGIECTTCRRRVLLERRVLERRMKAFVQRADQP